MSHPDAPPVPAHLAPYIETLGPELGVRFLLEFGGAPVYLADRPQQRAALASVLHPAEIARLVQATGGGWMRVPTGKPWIARYFRDNKNWSVAEISRKLHVTDVTVRAWLKAPDPRQINMFD